MILILHMRRQVALVPCCLTVHISMCEVMRKTLALSHAALLGWSCLSRMVQLIDTCGDTRSHASVFWTVR